MTVADLVARLDEWFPKRFAASWDNTGLLLGDVSQPVQCVMTCLTVTEDVVAEAVAGGVQLLVAHHPVLFKGAKGITTATVEGRTLLPLLRHGISVYSPHTRFDNAAGGINDTLAGGLELNDIRPLRLLPPTPMFKLAVYVPQSDLERVQQAMFDAGGGKLGNYDQCSFRVGGIGTFRGNAQSNPTIGSAGVREEVIENRLELLVPERALQAVLAAMRAAHSYEEPAFDVLPMHIPSTEGEGRTGELATPVLLGEFAELVKTVCRVEHLQFVGDPEKKVQKIALACGAAGEFLTDAIHQRADLFLTGELRFHEALLAQASDMACVVAGHYGTERPAVVALANRLRSVYPQLHCTVSAAEHDPLQWR